MSPPSRARPATPAPPARPTGPARPASPLPSLGSYTVATTIGACEPIRSRKPAKITWPLGVTVWIAHRHRGQRRRRPPAAPAPAYGHLGRLGGEDGVELRIPVAEQQPELAGAVVEGDGQIAGLLAPTGCCWAGPALVGGRSGVGAR